MLRDIAAVVVSLAALWPALVLGAPPPSKGPSPVTGGTCLLRLTNGWHAELRSGQVFGDDPQGIDPVLFPAVVDGTLRAFDNLAVGALIELWVPEGDLVLQAVSSEGTPHILDGIVCGSSGAPVVAAFDANSDATGPLVVANRMSAPLLSVRVRAEGASDWGASLLPLAGLAAGAQVGFLPDEVPIAGSVLLQGSLGESWVFPYALHTPMGAVVVADAGLANAGPPCELELKNQAPVPVGLMWLRGEYPLTLMFATPVSHGVPPGASSFTPIPPGSWEVTWWAPGEPSKTGKELVPSCPAGGAAVVTVTAGG